MDFKTNFPRLKAYSNLTEPTKSLKSHKTTFRISTIQSQKFHQTNQLSQKLNSIRLKYINKSPNYFKNKFRSNQTLHTYKVYDQSIEDYVGEQCKVMDKEMLMEMAKKRVKKFKMNHDNKKKQLEHYKQQNSIDQLHNMKQSKYQNFRPLKVPLKHNIKYIKHPDLTMDCR